MQSSVLNSPRLKELKKRRRRVFLNKVLLYIFSFGAVLGLLAYLSRLPGINIESTEARGNNIVESEEITSIIEREISGQYLWLIPKTNILVYPKQKIGVALEREFSRLENIELSIENNRKLVVSVTEREPAYLWCQDEACYFMDRIGYIFDEAPYFSGNVYFKFFEGGVLSPKNEYFAREHFDNLVAFKDILVALGLEPVSLRLKNDGDAEIILAGTGESKILFRGEADAENLGENLAAALETEPLKTRFDKEYSKLEYLDLRFDNKVYSKFK